MLTGDQFFAGVGGRRMLTRVELSGDRTRATLFYLEPLPGSSRINVVFDGTGLKDAAGRPLDADGDGLEGGAAVFSFETLSLAPLTGTAVVGRVFASELAPGPDTGTNAVNKPLAGVTITVDGMEQTIRAVTDAQGNFTLNNTPAGRFFVHIDGRTVTDAAAGIHYPDKAYYPFVGKAWEAVAGRTDNKAGGTGEIYLPLIAAGTLQVVSATQDTTITFPPAVVASNPALAGVNITVPANSLFSDSGARGGKVGIAAVPPDRLPGPLPPGLELPIVITVQTDGALNFDQPAPICFPNLPDPVLKAPLPAGSKQALISFNHDTGIWEAAGTMTVSADGRLICTDPGAGIRQPGWHGVGPLPNDPPPCNELCCDGGGGGGPGPLAGFSNLGRISKAGPKPKQCKPPPCKMPQWQCETACLKEKQRCDKAAEDAYQACYDTLIRGKGCNTNFTSECNSKMRICEEIASKLRKPKCQTEYLNQARSIGLAFPRRDPTARHSMRRFNLYPVDETFQDRDRDGLVDAVELIYGTDETLADSDGDGIADGAEVGQGTNPLDGVPVRIGIVGSVRTPAAALDVVAGNDLLAVAEGTAGVSLFNIFKGMEPVWIGQVDTPGMASGVAMSGNLLAVADGEQGLAVIDVSDPANAQLLHQVPVVGIAQSVAVAADVAYVVVDPAIAGRPSSLVTVDLSAGRAIETLRFADPVDDVAVAGDLVYLLRRKSLEIYDHATSPMQRVGAVALPASAIPVDQRLRLFVGGGFATVGHRNGHTVIGVGNPAQPVVVGVPPAAQLSLSDTTSTGSGLLVATTANTAPNPRQVALYDNSAPSDVTKFLTLFDTPGEALAVTIHNGLAYVADNAPGIQVVNYVARDNQGLAPAVSLVTSASGAAVEAGRPLRMTANAVDDVQVRHVEFYIDGAEVFADGSFPFEHRFVAPPPTATKTRIKLRARAVDTGGNFTWSEELTFNLTPDSTPPRIVGATPIVGAREVKRLQAVFDEPLAPATVNGGSFQLIGAGVDGQFDTPDDAPVAGGVVTYLSGANVVSLDFAAPLDVGLYRGRISTAVTDLVGNHLATDFAWEFRVADAVFWITDADGLWEDPVNWSEGVLPGPNDDVILDVPADVQVTHGAGTHVVRSLQANERLRVTGGVLDVAGAIAIGQPLTTSAGKLRGGSLTIDSASQLGGPLEVPGVIELHAPLTVSDGSIQGATVNQNGPARLIFASKPFNTLDGVTINGDLNLTDPGAHTQIKNGLTLHGNLLLDHNGQASFIGDQTFDDCTVVFAGDSGSLAAGGTGTLTLGPGVVVRGKAGRLDSGSFNIGGLHKIVNQGLISAEVAGGKITIAEGAFENAGRIESKNGGSLDFRSASWSNTATGVIDAAGGTLGLSGNWSNQGTINVNEAAVTLGGAFQLADLGTFNRIGGTVTLAGVMDLNGGTLTLGASRGSWILSDGTIKNGTLTQQDGARLVCAFKPFSTLDGLTINGDLNLTDPSAHVQIKNGLTLHGSLLLDRSGQASFIGDQTLDDCTVVFAGDAGFIAAGGTGTLTLGPGVVVHGKAGQVGPGLFNIGGGHKIVNQGLISADVAGGRITIAEAAFENGGRIESKNGGSLDFRSANWSNAATGVIDAAGGALGLSGNWSNLGTINVNGVAVILAGTLKLADLGAFHRTGGSVTLAGVMDLNGGTLTLGASLGSWILSDGTIKNGTLTQEDGARLVCAFKPFNTLDGVTINGDLNLTDPSAHVQIKNGLTLHGSLRLDHSGQASFIGSQTLDNCTVFFAGDSGSLAAGGNTTLTLGPAMVVRGRSGQLAQGLFGFGGNDRIVNLGLIWADASGGTLTVNPSAFTNTGVLRASDGGILRIKSAQFTDNGTREELTGGKVLIGP